jgi:hypothetical protein
MPLEVGGALRLRLEAETRSQIILLNADGCKLIAKLNWLNDFNNQMTNAQWARRNEQCSMELA